MEDTVTKYFEDHLHRCKIEGNDREMVMENTINQQYTYTTREAIATFKDLNGNFDWVPTKDGQTIQQFFLDRISQQRSASNLTKATILGCFGVHENFDLKLDNKLREYLYDTYDDFLEVNFEDDGQGTEWMLTKVTDIYDELGFYPSCVDDILSNDEFMSLWFQKIKSSKFEYFDEDDTISKVYKLRPWQDKVITEMLGSGKTYHQLGLAARFGKTLAVLDYSKIKILNNIYKKDKLFIVPASKSLSSNASFVKDFDSFGFSRYFNIVRNVSLFKNEDKIIESLNEELPKNPELILVTDEGDFASHTEISTDKIKLIKENFNVVEQIVMTGTGIGKAAKIFKSILSDEINFSYVTYDDMLEMGGPVVKRHIVNVQFNIESDFDEPVKNIRQSIEDPLDHEQVSKYLYHWTLDKVTEQRANLQPSDIVMIFVKPERNEQLHQLMERFQNMYETESKCIALTGNSPTGKVTNRTAEKKVNRTYRDMRKVGDMRKLIVFSSGIGNRSFSESKICRVIEMSDGEITSANIQEFARAYTWEPGKEIADVIRIGFSPMSLAEQIYLIENEVPDYGEKSKTRAGKFLNNNSFTDIIMDGVGQFLEYRIRESANGQDIGTFLDEVCKFTDRTSYITTRLWGEGLTVDVDPKKQKKNKTSSISTSVKGKKLKTKKLKNGDEKLTSKDEQRLRHYVNIVRCIPSLAQIEGISIIEDFVNNSHWDDYLEIDKDIFKDNYNNSSEFKEVVDSLFRLSDKKDFDEHNKMLIEYMGIRS